MKNNLTKSQKLLCDLCGNVLFDKNCNIPEKFDLNELFTEAKHQTVFPIACVGLKKEKTESVFRSYIVKNLQVDYNHIEISELLKQNNIKHVFIKGVVSASYYKDPTVRTMGDVDVLIDRQDMQKVHSLLLKLGYITGDNILKEDGHIRYKKKIKGAVYVCEVHFSINGIPTSMAPVFDKYLSNILDTTKEIAVPNGKCPAPSDFHHGIVLLLHTATHLTNEGVGLRHLCDWAIFENRFSNDEFVSLFETPLKEMGLWKFAQLITLCCEKYLGADKRQWAGKAQDGFIDEIVADIMNGGNFGHRQTDRYRQVKYISDRENQKISKRGTFSQILSNLNAKAKTEYSFTKKCRLLLPIGWLCVVFKYMFLVLTHKRRFDNINTINAAKYRKNLYNEFELFQKGD